MNPSWSYGRDGLPDHGDYCPDDNYACCCGLFSVLVDVLPGLECGLGALCGCYESPGNPAPDHSELP